MFSLWQLIAAPPNWTGVDVSADLPLAALAAADFILLLLSIFHAVGFPVRNKKEEAKKRIGRQIFLRRILLFVLPHMLLGMAMVLWGGSLLQKFGLGFAFVGLLLTILFALQYDSQT